MVKQIKSTSFFTEHAVMILSAAITVIIALWGILSHETFGAAADMLMTGLQEHFSWLYLGVMLLFVFFSLGLALSNWGQIRLGEDDERPEYSTISWFAMLFGTGMGIGMVFWSVAEPLSHYIAPMAGITPGTPEAKAFAMRSCFMHWGLHPWACYAVMGLGLAYFQFRRKESALASNLLKPLWGDTQSGKYTGTAVDVFTTVLTTTGVATSFGMGCLQISEGLNYLFGIPSNLITWTVIIVVICFIYLRSAISGVSRGIKKLSDINLVFFVILMVLAFAAGPMLDTLKLGLNGMADYLKYFLSDSLRMQSEGDSGWIQAWRVFYWAWWLSWAPFVGIFIARISRGRTIREFIFGVMIIPTLVSILWFTVFGGLTLNVTDQFSSKQLAVMSAHPETALFHIFDKYPLGLLLSLIALMLLVTFFITSANSATFVLGMLTSHGELDPPAGKKTFWGILIAVVAFALILSGSIEMIQTISIVIAFPYLFILLLICVSLVLALRKDKQENNQNDSITKEEIP